MQFPSAIRDSGSDTRRRSILLGSDRDQAVRHPLTHVLEFLIEGESLREPPPSGAQSCARRARLFVVVFALKAIPEAWRGKMSLRKIAIVGSRNRAHGFQRVGLQGGRHAQAFRQKGRS